MSIDRNYRSRDYFAMLDRGLRERFIRNRPDLVDFEIDQDPQSLTQEELLRTRMAIAMLFVIEADGSGENVDRGLKTFNKGIRLNQVEATLRALKGISFIQVSFITGHGKWVLTPTGREFVDSQNKTSTQIR